jgi:hypothetical protein
MTITNLLVMAGCLAAGFLITFLIERTHDALRSWVTRRAIARAGTDRAPLMPESLFIVQVGDADVVCDRPDGKREHVTWDELERVEIVSTSEGPFVPDTFWLLVGTTGGCAIPWGATGERELLARLQDLPGFDNGAVIDAASDVTDNRRTCWERSRTRGDGSEHPAA